MRQGEGQIEDEGLVVGLFQELNAASDLSGVVQVVNLSALGYVVTGLSVGIGFGLQQIVADFFSGLILLFERPLKVGDVVDLDGQPGVVTDISLRSTTVQTLLSRKRHT